MKKILLALTAVAFIGAFCFVRLPQARAEEAKTFVGKVESVAKRIGKPPKWIYALLAVTADSGEKMAVHVIRATAVTDASGKDMCDGGKKLGAIFIKKGQRVEVKYSVLKDGRNEAVSVRCLD